MPADVTLLALHHQRVLRLLAERRALGDATLRALPRDVLGEARDTVAARRALDAIPRGKPPRVRVAPAAPASTLRAAYAEAQRRFGVDWSVLAAVNFVESAFGRVRSASEAGARGPMQFLPGDVARVRARRRHRRPARRDPRRGQLLASVGRVGECRPCVVRLQPLDRLRARRASASRRGCARTSAAFRTYYAWQVYVRTPERLLAPHHGAVTMRLAPWATALALPLALVILLRSAPKLDARWEVDPVHFWIVLAAGVVNAGLAVAISEAGRRAARRAAAADRARVPGQRRVPRAARAGDAERGRRRRQRGLRAGDADRARAGGRVRGGLGGRVRAEGLAADRRTPRARSLGAVLALMLAVGDRLRRRAAAAARPGHARPGRGAAERRRRARASSSTATRAGPTSASGGGAGPGSRSPSRSRSACSPRR